LPLRAHGQRRLRRRPRRTHPGAAGHPDVAT
jgi:hypothetical protein